MSDFTQGDLLELNELLEQLRDISSKTAEIFKNRGRRTKFLMEAKFLKYLVSRQFTASQLCWVGATATEMKKMGFNLVDIVTAQFTTDQLVEAGFTTDEVDWARKRAQDLEERSVSAH